MPRFPAVASLLLASAALAGPVNISPEEHDRQARVLDQLKKAVAAEASDAAKLAVVARLMKEENAVDVRAQALELATQVPGADLDAFLTALLGNEPDAGLRGRAATALGHLGSEKCLAALAECAANDRTTDVEIGCMVGRSSARRAATFAVAELAARHPKIADEAAAKLRALSPVAKDNEGLADARVQALYQLTHDDELLKSFFERIKSKDSQERVQGIVAFQFLKLTKAPPEVVAALDDANPDIASWAALVLGEIGDAKTAPPLMAIAGDAKKEVVLRCNAIGALGRMKTADASDLMERLLTDDDARVVANAAISLHRITGKKVKQFPEGYRDD
ncbi:MAG TPA: HEAT repeat domain-containing protein [Gemmataceae bacterium]|nr:HEAT repeat domain-containing protein [Gemmataceae bacterium]